MRPLPRWRSWPDIEGLHDDPESGTLSDEMAEHNWDVWRKEVIEEWKGPKLLLSDAHHLLDLLCAKLYVAGSDHSYPPSLTLLDKRFRDKSVPELIELLWFSVVSFSSFASPAIDILERLQELKKSQRVPNAAWLETMYRLLDALFVEQVYMGDYDTRRRAIDRAKAKAEKEARLLKPMLDAAYVVARELWIANERRWPRGHVNTIERETSKRLPDDQKGLAEKLTRRRLDPIKKQIERELPPN